MPFYLEDTVSDGSKTVRSYYIYSRNGDTNTPIDKQADAHIIDKLWSKRFGLDIVPLDRFIILIEDTDNWEIDFGNKKYAYNKLFPEFKLEIDDFQECYHPCATFYTNPSMHVAKLKLVHHTTILYESECWAVDEFRRKKAAWLLAQ